MIKKGIALALSALLLGACSSNNGKKDVQAYIDQSVKYAAEQLTLQTDRIEKSGKILIPRTIKNDSVKYVNIYDWTSGFFAGSMWYMYDLTRDKKWEKLAEKYTEHLDSVQYLTWHHDVGFMIGCSYLNGYRLQPNDAYKKVIITAAASLATRYRPNAHVIQSWDADRGWQATRGWKCPVIIDNMMNLELLFAASELSGDSTYRQIAINHANTTMLHHFRPDYSSYHVVDYDPETGAVRSRQTAQGYSDESDWARGQAWGLYGYTVCYRFTKDTTYLHQAEHIAKFILNNPNMPADMIPYWDYKAPDIPNAPRDASAAACTASALYELSTYVSSDMGMAYRMVADEIMASLASPQYRAAVGTNQYFLLMHSVGSLPHHQEVDVPLNYADYYYLQALDRMKRLELLGDKSPLLTPITSTK